MDFSRPRFKKLLIFQEGTFQSRKIKKPALKNFLYFLRKKFFLNFGKWNFLALDLKNF